MNFDKEKNIYERLPFGIYILRSSAGGYNRRDFFRCVTQVVEYSFEKNKKNNMFTEVAVKVRALNRIHLAGISASIFTYKF